MHVGYSVGPRSSSTEIHLLRHCRSTKFRCLCYRIYLLWGSWRLERLRSEQTFQIYQIPEPPGLVESTSRELPKRSTHSKWHNFELVENEQIQAVETAVSANTVPYTIGVSGGGGIGIDITLTFHRTADVHDRSVRNCSPVQCEEAKPASKLQ